MTFFHLYIRASTDAFGPPTDEETRRLGDVTPATRNEVARILRNTADRIERGEDFSHYRTLHDANGNDVGRAAFKEEAR